MSKPPSAQEIAELQEACDFGRLAELVKTQVESILRDTRAADEPAQRIYGCGAWLDLEQSGLGLFVSRIGPFEARLDACRKKSPHSYANEVAALRLKYYDYSTEYHYPDKALQACLASQQNLTWAFYEKFGEDFLAIQEDIYGNRLLAAVSDVLVNLRPRWEALGTTDDFVTYITLSDSSYEEEYQALLTTMSRAEADKIMPYRWPEGKV